MVGKEVDEAWLSDLKDQVVVSIAQSVEGLTPVTLATTTVDLSQVVPEKGTRNFINDSDDLRIVDEAMEVAVFRAIDDGRTVATPVNQGATTPRPSRTRTPPSPVTLPTTCATAWRTGSTGRAARSRDSAA